MRVRLPRAGIALLATSLALGACGTDNPEADPTTPSASTAGTTAEPSGDATTTPDQEADTDAVLRVIGHSPPDHLDPVRAVSPCTYTHLRMVYDSLIRLDAEGRPQPGLAVSWSSPDELTFEMQLREGVQFQDGSPFDADAVVAHLERGLAHPESTLVGNLELIESVEAVDDLSVRLNLAEPRAGILPTLLAEAAGMVPSPRAVEDGDTTAEGYGVTTAVGAGPYAYEDLVTDQLLEVRSWGDDDYWDADNRLLAGIDFHPVDDTTGFERIRSGEIDYMATKDSNLAQVEQDPDLEHVLSPTNTFAQIFVNFGTEPFDRVEVRQALNHALDRELLVETLTDGGGTIARGPLPPTSWGHSPAVDEMYPYDPDRARELLASAGYEDGLSFEAAMIEHPYYTRIAQAVQDMLKESGIEMELVSVPSSDINNVLYIREEFDAAITAYAGSTDPALTFEAKYMPNGAANPSGQTIDGLPELLAAGARTTEQSERAGAYQAAEELVMEQAIEIPIFFLGGLSVFAPHVEGVVEGHETCAVGSFIQPPVWVASP